jgi:hypothetical protein
VLELEELVDVELLLLLELEELVDVELVPVVLLDVPVESPSQEREFFRGPPYGGGCPL